MAFRTITEFNDARYGGLFLLKNDLDSADVVFMYRNIQDVLIADVHYIKSPDYSGYVHCLEGKNNCPACDRGIRIQQKLFIPLYILNSNQVETGTILFWDRNVRFENVLEQEVFSKFPNPIEYVFRITRHGAAGDINTRYSIKAIAKNTESYDDILSTTHMSLPESYESVVKTWSYEDYQLHMNQGINSSVDIDSMPEYKITPRSVVPSAVEDMPEFTDDDDNFDSDNEVEPEDDVAEDLEITEEVHF